MKKQSLLHGALILMLAGFINRLLGFVLRVILVRIVGDEGLGLFQMIYPFFMTLLLISTAGFPISISKLIPEHLSKDDVYSPVKLLKITLITVTILGSTMALLLNLSAGYISTHIFSDPRTHLLFIAISPALIISPLAASFRGFFQGFNTMVPTAISQITEQICRLSATLIIINMLTHLELKFQAAGLALGISVGELAGLIILFILYIYHIQNYTVTKNRDYNYYRDLKKISKLALPITMGRLIHSLMSSAEAILIPRQLEFSGNTVQEATSLYGQLSGMVEQVIFLPTVITIALTISLIPNISEANANKNYKKIKKNYKDILRISAYLGFPVSIIFINRGKEICHILFGYPEAGILLSQLAISAAFIYYLQVSSGMLNGLGHPGLAVRNLAVGSVIKLILIYFLVQKADINMKGAIIGLATGYILAALLNFISIKKLTKFKYNYLQIFIKPLFASIIIYFIDPYLNLDYLKLPYTIKVLTIIFVSIIIYLIIMILITAIKTEDIERFKS